MASNSRAVSARAELAALRGALLRVNVYQAVRLVRRRARDSLPDDRFGEATGLGRDEVRALFSMSPADARARLAELLDARK
jgi:hypothetical protein